MKNTENRSHGSGGTLRTVLITVAVMLCLLLMLTVILFKTGIISTGTQIVRTDSGETVEKNRDVIDIPGFEALTLKADSTLQQINLSNPAQNTCYFRISLILEDGTVLWRSELIKPGYGSRTIKLDRALEAGAYPNSTLKYECFTMDGSLTPLNGAETRLTIFAD